MKKIIFIIIMTCSGVFNAQVVSLELMAQCLANPSVCPENYNYVKDVNSLLNKYVGTWKGTLDGKNYEFNFIKKEGVGNANETKWDMLIGRVKIVNENGIVEFDNFNKPDSEANLGYNFQPDLKIYLNRFTGSKIGCIDYGFLYLYVKPETPNKMSINFWPDRDIVQKDCSNFQTTLSTNKIIHLTKQ